MSALRVNKKIFLLQFAFNKVNNFRAYSTQLDLEEESKQAHEIFTNVGNIYNATGTFASFGQHNFWKDRLTKMAVPEVQGMRYLDAAGGQGAIAIRMLNLINNTDVEKDFHVTVCDNNAAMMNHGKRVLAAQKHNPKSISWVEGSVENLPFKNETFNVFIISMGFRSIQLDKTFAEAYRVLKPGSKFYCLDVSPIDNPFIYRVHKFLLSKVVPYLGYKIWKTHEPFNYYVRVYETMPRKEKIKDMIEEAGFSQVTYKSMSLGLGCIHSGNKL